MPGANKNSKGGRTLNNQAFSTQTGGNPIANQIENKLAVVSETGYGHEFPLFKGRTTIGRASTNDVVLQDMDVSGFHAEIRSENEAWTIVDFKSEKGTFLNEKRVTHATRLNAGDRIKFGSTSTVFIPLDIILVRESIGTKDAKDGSKTSVLGKHKKRLISTCAIVLLLCAIKIATNIGGNREAENRQVADSSVSQPQATSAGKHVSSSAPVRSKETSSKNGESVKANARQNPMHKKSAPLDKIASVNYKIASTFANYQLWNEALEHYRRVSGKRADYPGLSGQIDKMQFEIGNKTAFEKGMALIESGRYEQGAAILETIGEKSHYYPKSMQEIEKAAKYMTKARKK
jgi:pSer/pThr/pTyr-binding forkhead associated (FHA) protein